jgi:hypothetical protein
MRKSANTGDGAVPRSRNRSSDISNGNKSEHVSGIRAMKGCGDRTPVHQWDISRYESYERMR